mgnify:CR=1 FL=1
MKKSTLFVIVLLSAFVVAAFQTTISAAEKLMIPVGKSTSIPAHGVKKILAVKEGIVDVLNVSDEDIILSGLSVGETQLILWDMTGRRVYDVETYSENDTILAKFVSVMGNKNLELVIFPDIAYLKGQVSNPEDKTKAETVAQSLLGGKPLVSLIEFEASFTSLQQRIEAAIKLPNVKVSVISPEIDPNIEQSTTAIGSQTSLIRVVLQGSVKDQNEYIHLTETVKGFVQDEEKVSNLVIIDEPIQVVFQAYILQVSKNNQKDMGIEWSGQNAAGDIINGVLNFGETAGADGKAVVPKYMNPFFMKNINRFDLIAAQVKAWETSGKAKVLANPKLIVYGSSISEKPDIMARKMSGAGWIKENDQAENESTIETDAGNAYVSVGQQLYFAGGLDQSGNPTYEPVEATLKLSIRDLFVNDDKLKFSVFAKQAEPSFVRGGDGPPDILKRSIMTTLQIKDQETIVLGGLINRTQGVSWSGVPVLSKIPYIGRLFKTKSTTNSENELVILLTPKIANRDTDLSGKSKLETVPVPRRSDKLEKLHNIFQQIKSSHIPAEN